MPRSLLKFLSLLLCLTFCVGLVPAAFAEDFGEGLLIWDDGAWEEPAPETGEQEEPLFIFEEDPGVEAEESPEHDGNTTELPPVITSQPQDVNAAAGATVIFTVTATGAQSYQWQYSKNGGASWASSPATGNRTTTLYVPVAAYKNGYLYRCLVSNSAGDVTSETAMLTVGTKPVITSQPQDVNTAAGATAIFTVTAAGAETYQWQYSTNGGASWANSPASGNKTAALRVPVAAYKNGYLYRCLVSNADGTVISETAVLTVNTKPVITSQPQDVNAAAGATAIFTVTATGAEAYQWQYSKDGGASWGKSPASGNTTAALSIPVTTSRNGYQYRCKVTNAAGTAISEAATLTVNAKPVITSQPADLTAVIGTTAVFTVTATGAETYQWQYSKDGGASWGKSPASGNTTAALSIPVTASRNGYQYRCKVTNAAGTAISEAATLTATLNKPSITRAVVKGTKVTLTWTAVSGAKYTLYCGKVGESLSVLESGLSVTTKQVTGLDCGASYRFAVTATAGSVSSPQSSKVTVTTELYDGETSYRALLIGEVHFPSENATRNSGDVDRMSGMLAAANTPNGDRYAVQTRLDRSAAEICGDIRSAFAGADEDDVSLFFIATHGVVDVASGDQAGALQTISGSAAEYLPLGDLASWLSDVPGRVIVLIGSCGSGAAVYDESDPDFQENGVKGAKGRAAGSSGEEFTAAFDAAVAASFAARDQIMPPEQHVYYFDEDGNESDILLMNTGEFRTDKFYVLTAARHQESSYGSEPRGYNLFTYYLIEGVTDMAADTNGDGAVSLHELFLYIDANATGPWTLSDGTEVYQHVQEYPRDSDYVLFVR